MRALFAGLALAIAACAQPIFRFTEKPGPHAVGLKVVEQYDRSRVFRHATDELGQPYSGERARPLQMLIWYPAQAGAGKPMTVAAYGDLAATETSFGHPKMAVEAEEWIQAMKPSLGSAMWAVRDAPAAPGRFPVVIYAPSFSAMSWENADLCEYLASHGYVVLASPDMGATDRPMTSDIAGIDAQAQDISFLIGYAQTLANADPSGVAVAGFSWGGISNLFAAARDSRIRALIALDGSMRYFPGFVKEAGVRPEEMTIPLLYFAQGEITLEEQARYFSGPGMNGPSVLNAWTHGDLITAHMLGLVHVEHSSMYQRNEDSWKRYRDDHKADYEREDGVAGYAWIARYTLHFLNAYLKHDPQAMEFLKKTPAENGVPKYFMTVTFRAAQGAPASYESFRSEVGRKGFGHAAEVYAAMQKDKPDFKLDQTAMHAWSNDLIAGRHFAEAIGLLKFEAQIFSDSGTLDSLGDAYRRSGQTQLAVESYKKALEKSPFDETAKAKLKELENAK